MRKDSQSSSSSSSVGLVDAEGGVSIDALGEVIDTGRLGRSPSFAICDRLATNIQQRLTRKYVLRSTPAAAGGEVGLFGADGTLKEDVVAGSLCSDSGMGYGIARGGRVSRAVCDMCLAKNLRCGGGISYPPDCLGFPDVEYPVV